tara:strand:+ start:3083 stop:4330 length:1248 start_codon:yes stop_codon:yes gene_type:complete
MNLKYVNDILTFDNIDIQELGQTIETPYYLYSENIINKNVDEYISELQNIDSLICYSVKANSNLSILSLFAKKGLGFDIVSGGELQRVMKAGGDMSKVVFSGVGKTDEEIEFALKQNIYCFNVESQGELNRIQTIASSLDVRANISLRVNPEIDAKTHPYITTGLSENKFGISQNDVLNSFKIISNFDSLNICGIDYHIGSQIIDLEPFTDSAKKVLSIINELKKQNIFLSHVDLGGGLGISYNNESPVSRGDYVQSVVDIFKDTNLKIIFEPGRSIIGDSGILVTKVIETKNNKLGKNFIIVDAGMNDLIRPPLYNAYHKISSVTKHSTTKDVFDVVGPVCETADFFGKDRHLSANIGDLIVIEDTGAYGFVLSSNYNSRPRVAEYLISKNNVACIRRRETFSDIIGDEEDYLK